MEHNDNNPNCACNTCLSRRLAELEETFKRHVHFTGGPYTTGPMTPAEAASEMAKNS